MAEQFKARSATVTKLRNESDAADLLNIKPKTLQRWRWTGVGPPFIKVGRAVRYDERDLLTFLDAQRRQSTTKA